MKGTVEAEVARLTPTTNTIEARCIPIESPIAIEFNGIGYAVMMATPLDLEDFATGFALSERLVACAEDILAIEPHETPDGWLLKIQVDQAHIAPIIERVRVRVSESSCGLCGLENLEQIARPLPPINAPLEVDKAAMFRALAELRAHQPLNAATGGTHAAAFCATDGSILLAREDVGRHCALDKLIGAMARAGHDPAMGFILLSSRCSYELVEKTVLAGCPMLVTISTATSLALDRAKQAGLALLVLARSDAMLRVHGR